MKAVKRNAVLFKEMTVDMKKPKVLIILILVNAAVLPILIGFGIYMIVAGFEGQINYRALANFFTAVIYTLSAVLLFITPAITAGSVSLEKERQTLDVLLTTRLTPWEIIKGKYLSNYVLLALMVFSTIPMLSTVFIYGGFPFWKFFYVFVVLFVYIALIASIGIFFSTLTKNTILSVILTYLVTFFFISITAIIPPILVIAVEAINDIIYHDYNLFYFVTEAHLINGDYLLMLGIFNPIYMIFDVLGHTSGYVFGDVGIEGMNSFCDIMVHTTPKNILFRLWTPISIVVQLLMTFIILRISGAMLNPIRRRKKKRNKR